MKNRTEYGNTLEIEITPESDKFVLGRCVHNTDGLSFFFAANRIIIADLVENENHVVTLEIEVRVCRHSGEHRAENMWVNVKNLESGKTSTYFFDGPQTCADVASVYHADIRDLELHPIE